MSNQKTLLVITIFSGSRKASAKAALLFEQNSIAGPVLFNKKLNNYKAVCLKPWVFDVDLVKTKKLNLYIYWAPQKKIDIANVRESIYPSLIIF